MTALTLDREDRAVLDWIEGEADAMVARVKAWSAINSGSRNADGLEAMRAELETAFAPLGGEITAVELAPSTTIELDGEIRDVEYTPAFRLTRRPDAPVKIVLTGHHDTVFFRRAPFLTPGACWTTTRSTDRERRT